VSLKNKYDNSSVRYVPKGVILCDSKIFKPSIEVLKTLENLDVKEIAKEIAIDITENICDFYIKTVKARKRN
jgi:hypothetical protein